jgi:AI-2 transport protein TqsA
MPGEWDYMTTIDNKMWHLPQLVSFVIVCTAAIAALHFGESILRPLALAILMTILLNAMTNRLLAVHLGPFRIPRWMGLAASLGIVSCAVLLTANILIGQIDSLTVAWRRYVVRLEELVSGIAELLGAEIAGKIEIKFQQLDIASWASSAVGTTGSVLAELGMVTLYVTFLLAAKNSNVHKHKALFPEQELREKISRMLASMAESTGKYIFIKTIMSTATGLVSYTIMKMVGLDFAETWALLIFLLNFIPTIGSIVAVIFPSILSLLQFDTMVPFFVITGCLTSVQLVLGNVIEPIFTGRSLNLSSLVVLLALAFWGLIWGIPGMFMSVPLTVMAMIFCSTAPNLKWVAILLSDEGEVAQSSQ